MNLTKTRTGNWSSIALVGSFIFGMLIHRNASAFSKFKICNFLRKFESKNKTFSKKSKLNGQKQVATKCKLENEFDVNILFMN